MAIIDAVSRVLPVLLLFGLGALLRRRGFFAESTVADLRRFVLAVTLPSALFLTFLRVSLDVRYLPIVVLVFAACVLMLLAGPGLARLVGVRSPYAGPLMTGFEAGMLGYAIYGGVFGPDALYRFGVVDLGQVLFVFFVLATVLTRRATGVMPGVRDTVVAFIRTPVIVAILAGVVGNLVGLGAILDSSTLTSALLATLALLGACTTPLIAVVIGYSTRLGRGALSRPARTVAIRLTAWVTLAVAFTVIVVQGLLGLDALFAAAVMTMAILPPPFVIPLYMGSRPEDEAERDYVADTLSLATVVTLVAFPVVAAVFSG
ncbi:MAG: malate permease [Chloroflexota bacterium]|nr:malate permease [Chloroflexota bacterium]